MRRYGLLRDLIGILLLLAGLIVLPIVFPAAALRDFLVYVMAYGLLALSLNLLTGYTGLVSFGHAAYFASGAYIFGLLMQSGTTSIPAAFVIAVGGSAILAFVVGAICVRLTEIYFAFLTLAFQMLLHSVILTWVSLTGGDQGLMGGIPRPAFWGIDLRDPDLFYIFCAVLFVVSVFVLRQVTQSPFGYALRMIRDNQTRAHFLGVNVFWTKLLAFVIAGTIASVGGIILALFVSGAYPAFAFWTTSGEAIFMVMLGGTQVFVGPLVGAVVLQILNHFLTIYTSHSDLVLGIAILIAVLGLRRGIADFAYEYFVARKRKHAQAEALAAAPTEDRSAARTSSAATNEGAYGPVA